MLFHAAFYNPPPAPAPVVPTRGLVAAWPLNDGSGTTARETVAGLAGTLSGGAAWATGTRGSAISFAAGGSIVIPNGAAFDQLSGDVTLSMWVNVPNFGPYQGLLTKCASNAPQPIDSYLSQSSGVFTVCRGSPGSFRIYASPTPPALGVWQHLAAVLPAGNTGATFYLNGTASGTVGSSYNNGDNSVANNAGAAAGVGRRADGATQNNGQVQFVRLRNVALTAAEVLQEYRAG